MTNNIKKGKKMVKCPKCGSDDYIVCKTVNSKFQWDYQTDNFVYVEVNTVKCADCGVKFGIREFYKLFKAENM